MTAYEKGKEKTRELALEFQALFIEGESMSYSELAQWEDLLENRGRKYGLVREFQENGII